MVRFPRLAAIPGTVRFQESPLNHKNNLADQRAEGNRNSSDLPACTHSSHKAACASLGIRQSPRGETLIEPTFGPSGRQERLNWLPKNRLMKTSSQCHNSSGVYERSNEACSARYRIF